MDKFLVFFLVFLLSFSARAEYPWYATVGMGTMTVNVIKHTKAERQIINDYSQNTLSSITNKSGYKTLMIGRCVTDRVCFELGYLCCTEFSTTLSIKDLVVGPTDGSTFTVPPSLVLNNDQIIDLTAFSGEAGIIITEPLVLNVRTKREASVSATQLSVFYKIPVKRGVELFYRIGVYEYRVSVLSKMLLAGNMFLTEETERKEVAPMASFGADWKFSSKYSFRGEFLGTNNIRMLSGSIIYVLK